MSKTSRTSSTNDSSTTSIVSPNTVSVSPSTLLDDWNMKLVFSLSSSEVKGTYGGNGVGVAVGVNVGVGTLVGISVGVGVGEGVNVGVAVGNGVGVAVGTGVSVGTGVGLANSDTCVATMVSTVACRSGVGWAGRVQPTRMKTSRTGNAIRIVNAPGGWVRVSNPMIHQVWWSLRLRIDTKISPPSKLTGFLFSTRASFADTGTHGAPTKSLPVV